MKNSKAKILISFTTVVILAACQSGQNSNGAAAVDMEPEPLAEREVSEVRRRYQPRERPEPAPEPLEPREEVIPHRVEGKLGHDGPGLTLLIDATSSDAFRQSLELVASETSSEQYSNLRAAMEAIQIYDREAHHSDEAFLSAIDGLTGEEIIERAHQARSR